MGSQLPTPKVLGWPSRSLRKGFAADVPQRAFASRLSDWLAMTLAEKSAPCVLACPASELSVPTLSPQ